LRQGEVLTSFIRYELDVEKLRERQPIEVFQVTHPIVVVLSQDCDLEQDFTRRQKGKSDNLLASVLFCSVAMNDDEFRHGTGLGTKEWKKVVENREPRLHYLRAVPQADDALNEGLPDLIVDFRQYFSLPTEEAYFCAQAARRRCRLDTPYAEHLSQRFFSHMGRVALPLDHHLPLPEGTSAPTVVVQKVAAGGDRTEVVGNGDGTGVVTNAEAAVEQAQTGPTQPNPQGSSLQG
jgi:hypothetical protein